MARIDDMAVDAQMMAQAVADHPFHHAFGQTCIDHPAQRLGQRRIADNLLDPRPKA